MFGNSFTMHTFKGIMTENSQFIVPSEVQKSSSLKQKEPAGSN